MMRMDKGYLYIGRCYLGNIGDFEWLQPGAKAAILMYLE